MFEDIREYMKLSREDRRAHLQLEEKCIEIGGDSRTYRGLLAHRLKTTISKGGKRVLCCHACNNAGCSNPNHLYWGTDGDNSIDANECGRRLSQWEYIVNKHGEKKARELARINGSKGGKIGGQRTAKKRRITREKLLEWRGVIEQHDLAKHGWIKKVSQQMNVSHTQTKRIIKKHFPDLTFYQRKSKSTGL